MARDPASRLISWFGWLMVAAFGASAGISFFTIRALWRLVRALVGG